MSKNYSMYVLLAAALAVASIPEQVFAFANMNKSICYLAHGVQTDLAKGMAILAIMVLALGAYFGKVNFQQLVMVTVGIAGTLGAASIVTVVFSSSGCESKDTKALDYVSDAADFLINVVQVFA